MKRILALCCVIVMLAATVFAVIPASAANEPERWPTQVTYVLEKSDDGYAKGEITVKLNAWTSSDYKVDAVMYWANASGILSGYTALARFPLSVVSTTFSFPELQIIPEGATKIRVYTALNGSDTLSTEFVEADLPANAGYSISGNLLNEFAVISDTHIVNSTGGDAQNLKTVLNDLKVCMPNGEAIFINGDVVDGCKTQSTAEEDITKVTQQWSDFWTVKDSVNADIPVFMATGNHDLWPTGFKVNVKDKMIELFCANANKFLAESDKTSSLTYDFWIDDCHFVFFGDDDMDGNMASVNGTHLAWLDQTIAAGYDDEHKTFLFLHQALSNTVAGTITNFGQTSHGIQNVAEVRAILQKYPDAIMFNSHSHYAMNSVGNAYYVDNYPTAFNTSSVRPTAGDHDSEGYVVRVYEDKVVVLGRDFTKGEWLSSAQYVVPFTTVENEQPSGGQQPEDTTPEDATPEDTTPEDTTPIATEPQSTETQTTETSAGDSTCGADCKCECHCQSCESERPIETHIIINNIYCDCGKSGDTDSSTEIATETEKTNETETIASDNVESETKASETDAPKSNGGCGGTLGVTALAVAIVPVVAFAIHRKKED